ncbi:MAG: glycosyltransferase [Bacteroidales bacterium]|nr:glycosyltransferase [Bacteroidales bacterium]
MKILVILPRFPFPLEKGDKLRAYHQIRTLSNNNEVFLFALSHKSVPEYAIAEMRKYCKEIHLVRLPRLFAACNVIRNFFGTRSLQIGYWDSKKARNQFRQFEAEVNPDVIYAQMVRTMIYAAHSVRPKVLDFQDALSMNLERRMSKYRGLRYFALHYEFKMLRSAEYNACGIFDALTIISESDSDAVPRHKDTEIEIVRNGVDFDYFRHDLSEKKNSVVFCGNMQYAPNIDAARFLVNDIMPRVWKVYPDANVVIAGATPKPSVKRLENSRVTVTGSVEDIRPYYAQSEVFVAPMRLGSGLQNKILEAMSMGVPCVTTPLANDTIGAVSGEDILIGNNADELADHIIGLLKDEPLRSRIAENASEFVRRHFSWEATGEQLQTILQNAIMTHENHEEVELEDE